MLGCCNRNNHRPGNGIRICSLLEARKVPRFQTSSNNWIPSAVKWNTGTLASDSERLCYGMRRFVLVAGLAFVLLDLYITRRISYQPCRFGSRGESMIFRCLGARQERWSWRDCSVRQEGMAKLYPSMLSGHTQSLVNTSR